MWGRAVGALGGERGRIAETTRGPDKEHFLLFKVSIFWRKAYLCF